MGKKIVSGEKWLDALLPEGVAVPSSTIISGPGGSGKPLVAVVFLAAWLRQGGKAIIFLINSDRTAAENLLRLYGMSPDDFPSQLFYLDFDPQADTVEMVGDDMVRANILQPEILEQCLEEGIRYFGSADNIMLFGAALNILFFSPTWGDKIFEKLKELITDTDAFTSVFSLSTNAFQEKVIELEKVADNLFYTRNEKPMKLFFRIERAKDVPFDSTEVEVPFSSDMLQGLKAETDKYRKKIIPMVSAV